MALSRSLLALVLSLVTLLAGVSLLGTSGWFITATALTTAGLGFNLFVPSAMVRGLSFVRILARYGERLAGHNATLKLLSDLRGWLFSRLFPRLPLPDRSLRHGALVSRLTADVDALDTAFLVAIGPLAAAVVVGTAMTAILAIFVPGAALPYGLALALAGLGVPSLMVLLGRKAGRDSVATRADLRMEVLDGVNGHADLVLLGALFWAIHVQIVGYASKKVDPLQLAVVQYAICAGLNFILALFFEDISMGLMVDAIGPILYAGLVSVGIAYTLQIIAQQHIDPSRAAILLSLEAVFAVLGGWLMLDETLSNRELLGCILMFAGMLLSQLPDQKKKEEVSRFGSERPAG